MAYAPLTLPPPWSAVIGGIIGRNLAKGKDLCAPCRTNKIPREIPPIPWYRQGPCQVCGLLQRWVHSCGWHMMAIITRQGDARR